MEPFAHYVAIGPALRRGTESSLDINKLAQIEPYVEVELYNETYPGIYDAGMNPVYHYYCQGRNGGGNRRSAPRPTIM